MLCHLFNFYGWNWENMGFWRRTCPFLNHAICDITSKSNIKLTQLKKIKLEEGNKYTYCSIVQKMWMIIVLDNSLFLVSATNHYSKQHQVIFIQPMNSWKWNAQVYIVFSDIDIHILQMIWFHFIFVMGILGKMAPWCLFDSSTLMSSCCHALHHSWSAHFIPGLLPHNALCR